MFTYTLINLNILITPVLICLQTGKNSTKPPLVPWQLSGTSSPGNIKIAVMGCEVNGPGEAKEADIGIACGKGSGVIFKKGKAVKRVKEKDIVKELLKSITT